jgi:hypothetical protein
MENNIWVRHTHPTVFESAPYGTLWKEIGDNNKHIFFVQLGKDGVIYWVRFGDFLEGMFEHILKGDVGSEEDILLRGLGVRFDRA